MFNLLRYFSIASAIVIIVVTTTLGFLYNRHESAELVATAENSNTTLAHSFANILRPRFFEYIGAITEPDGIPSAPIQQRRKSIKPSVN